MEGLLQAHDSIASLTDRVYCSPSNMNMHSLLNSSLSSNLNNSNTMPAKIPLHQSLSSNLQHDSKGYSSSTEDIKKVCIGFAWKVWGCVIEKYFFLET